MLVLLFLLQKRRHCWILDILVQAVALSSYLPVVLPRIPKCSVVAAVVAVAVVVPLTIAVVQEKCIPRRLQLVQPKKSQLLDCS